MRDLLISRRGRLFKALGLAALALPLAWAAPIPAQSRIDDSSPEFKAGWDDKPLVRAHHFMVASANPYATDAGVRILKEGGNAMDAAVAVAVMLGLTQPHFSGLGGGSFVVHYDAKTAAVTTFDGREKAPAAAKSNRFMQNGREMAPTRAMNSGLSVGVPGMIRVMELAHQKHGRLPWAQVLQPAIELAEKGFPVSKHLHSLLASNKDLPRQPAARAYFYDPAGHALGAGQILKNPEFANTVRLIAKGGADAFYRGAIARDIVAAVRNQPMPGDMTEADLANYQAKERAPVSGRYHGYTIYGMPPPSSGTIGVLQLLGILEYQPIAKFAPAGPQAPIPAEAVHYFSEAARLAYADRDYYLGDPDFVKVPTKALLDPAYLKQRSALIKPDVSMKQARPGDPAKLLSSRGKDDTLEIPLTSHISIVDQDGNAVSLTTTIEAVFGSKIMVRGFLLNNQLTDFSLNPVDAAGREMANAVKGGKRPRSTMSPLLVFQDGKLRMVVGSLGGGEIINYVAKTLVGVLDWNLNVQEAISLPNMGSRNAETELENEKGDLPMARLAGAIPRLRQMGHTIKVLSLGSGLQGIVVGPDGLSGGTDPRGEGVVKGE